MIKDTSDSTALSIRSEKLPVSKSSINDPDEKNLVGGGVLRTINWLPLY